MNTYKKVYRLFAPQWNVTLQLTDDTVEASEQRAGNFKRIFPKTKFIITSWTQWFDDKGRYINIVPNIEYGAAEECEHDCGEDTCVCDFS